MYPTLIIPFGKKSVLRFLFFVSLFIIWPGCGKKAPPVPPSRQPPPAVKDLSAVVEGDQVRLTWTIPDGPRKAKSALSGAVVHRSEIPLTEPYCPGCPILFERTADVSVKRFGAEKSAHKMSYTETLEKGFRYTYKVNVYTRNGAESSDSNHVTLSY